MIKVKGKLVQKLEWKDGQTYRDRIAIPVNAVSNQPAVSRDVTHRWRGDAYLDVLGLPATLNLRLHLGVLVRVLVRVLQQRHRPTDRHRHDTI